MTTEGVSTAFRTKSDEPISSPCLFAVVYDVIYRNTIHKFRICILSLIYLAIRKP